MQVGEKTNLISHIIQKEKKKKKQNIYNNHTQSPVSSSYKQ